MAKRVMDNILLEWYCQTCQTKKKFKYISSNVSIGELPEQYFYTCVSKCGRTYEQSQMISLENNRRVQESELEKCCD